LDIDRHDSIGAYITSVNPGSPAEKAGIQPGDFITKIDGQPVVSADDPRSPGLRLIRLVARLEPNASVSVELRRGNRRKTVSVVTAPEVSLALPGLSVDSGKWSFRVQPGDSETSGPKRFFVFVTSPWAELEVASLNADLGEYFGTTDGVLVVRVPSDSKLGLKGGDVVLAVDGKKPANPRQFLRMVESHKDNEPVNLTILRHRKRSTLTVKLNPEGKQ
jgi:serine protease Do